MTQRKIGNTWWVDVTHDKKRYRKKSPDNSKKGAQAYEATLRRKLAEGAPPQDAEKRNRQIQRFETFAWFWFETHVLVHNKPSMIAKTKGILTNKLIPFFGKKPLNQITALHVEQYKAQQAKKGLVNKTINNELCVLGKCLRDAKRWHDLDSIPDIVMLKTPPSDYDFLTEEECGQLLQQLSDVWFEITYVALKTGMRRGELQGLRWQDINFDNKTLTVKHSWCSVTRSLLSPKGNKARTIPLSDDVVTLLQRRKNEDNFVFMVNDTAFQPVTLGKQLSRACMQARLRKVTCHVLRHSYASHLAMKGAPIAVIQKLLGHTDIKITMRYAHLSQASLNDVVQYIQTPFVDSLIG